MLNEKMMNALVNSIDDKSSVRILELSPSEDFTITALITNKVWEDGAPVIKTFHRNNMRVQFTFKKGEQYSITVDDEHDDVYFYENNLWYMASSDDFSSDELGIDEFDLDESDLDE